MDMLGLLGLQCCISPVLFCCPHVLVCPLQANGVVISREGWLAEAENAERSNPPQVDTCRAIVKAVVGLGVDDEDRQRTWMGDAGA